MTPVPFRFLVSCFVLALSVRAQDPAPAPQSTPPARPAAPAAISEAPIPEPWEPRLVETLLEVQVELHRRGFSCGSIDDVMGLQTSAALRAFQRASDIPDTGQLDELTRAFLWLTIPPLKTHTFSADELEGLHPVPPTWLEKSAEAALGYASALELVAERYRASPALVRRLNPTLNWDAIAPGDTVTVPAVERIVIGEKAAQVVIHLESRTLQAFAADGRQLVHFPVSIAQKVEKRPVGEVRIKVLISDPNYTFDPEVYPESEEARTLGRKLVVPPGPNNPVGLAWIGLDLPGYGIHGTPEPEKVGRTESHGCFRLANWDAVTLLHLVAIGMPVQVIP